MLRRRAGLPSGRALVGALLVTIAGLGTYLAVQTDAATDPSYLVVTRPVAPGEAVRPTDVESRALALSGPVATSALDDPGALQDAVALVPLFPGQLLHTSLIGHPATNGRDVAVAEVTFPVDEDRIPPGLRRGEQVAVLATVGVGRGVRTEVAVPRGLVLDVDRGGDGLLARAGVRLTLALEDPTSVVATAHAARIGDLAIVRTTGVAVELTDFVPPAETPSGEPPDLAPTETATTTAPAGAP